MRGKLGSGDGRGGSPVGPSGVVLVITILLVGLLLVMGLTLINLSSSDYQVATNESRNTQALFNADAGTEEAKMRLSPNAPESMRIPVGTGADWRAYILSGHSRAEIEAGLDPAYGKAAPDYTSSEGVGNYAYYNTVQTGASAIPWGWARIQHKINSAGNIVYQNAVSGAETSAASQTVGGGVVYNPPILVVTTEGIQGSVRRMIGMELQPIVSTTTSSTGVVTDPFNAAAHGKSSVILEGNAYSDSYDSRSGPYNQNGNRRQKGNLSTDGTAAGAVTISSNATVNGDVKVGPGGNPSSAIQSSGTITGDQSAAAEAWSLPLSTIPAGVANQGPLTISGNTTRTLSEGTYWFSSINISGNGQLQISGAVKIYVTGNIDIGGNGMATAGNLPTNLLIYGTADPNDASNKTTSVNIHGNGNFYGALYAPDAAIQVTGNGGVFGSLTGASVRINGNGGLHYDEALDDLGRFVTTTTTTTYSTTGFSRYAWREIAF